MGVILSPDGLNAVQNVEVLKWEQILEFIKFEQMMGAMGIGIHCGYCSQAFGPPADGINMTINESDKTITLTCNHKERRFHIKSDEQMRFAMNV